MQNRLGVTQWNIPWKGAEACAVLKPLGLSAIHLDLGSSAQGYPMSRTENREAWLDHANRYGIEIVSLALNDLCNHGFTAGLSDNRSQTAVTTMKKGIETARDMNIPAISIPHFFANRIKNPNDYRATVEALRFVCDLGLAYGILIYTENTLNNVRLEALWNDVDRENLRLLFDSQNYSALGKADACSIFHQWYPFCGAYLHLKDGDGALGNRPLWMGSGNFEQVLTMILESDYRGALILESQYENQQLLEADLKKLRTRMEDRKRGLQ